MRAKTAIEKFLRRFFTGMAGILFPAYSFGQLNVSPINSASSLAQAIAGSGVTVSNATLNCGSNAAGTFTYAGSNLGLTNGILLTTGKAANASNPGNYLCSINNGNNFSDPDLTGMVPSATLDVCILAFDFVPTCNSLNMQFVFGSEEYPQGVGSYNDAFGVFLTGPDPSGGNYAAQNIAALPNGNSVSINNVNASTNSGYFHNNYSSPNADVAYNGYTIPVNSATSVVPCSTYSMKIAIADGGNALYDSGVFISDNGVSCQVPATITSTTTPTGPCQNSGTASVTVTNYTGTVTYHWTPGGQTTSSLSNLGVGTYTCVVSLHQSCGVITQTVTATVASSGSTMVLTSAQQNLSCNGATTGSATVSPVGGTAPFSCVWNTVPAQNGFTANNLSAGSYTATVTDNAGCQAGILIHITAPPPMHLNLTTSPATCTGATGSASVTVTANGTSPYSYQWNTSPVQNAQTISNVAQGSYSVTVTDAHSCSTTSVAIIGTQNPSWTLSALTQTDVSCFGGSDGVATVNISNAGASSFSYAWNTTPSQSSVTISNLAAANYTCTVTDNNGCIRSTVATVTQPALLTSSVTSAPTMCHGSVGSVAASAIGGTAPYTYSWSTSQHTNSVQGLAQGQYSVTITDAHNCSTSGMTTVGTVSPALQVAQSVTNSACGEPTGAISINTVTPAYPPFSYSWATGQGSASINGLLPGIYAVTVTDNNGCVGQAAITVNKDTVLPLVVNTSPDYCQQGIGQATAAPAGTPPYQYQWSSGSSTTSQTATGLLAGNYQVVVTDMYGCKNNLNFTVPDYTDGFVPTLQTDIDQVYAEEETSIDVGVNAGWTFNGGVLSDGTAITNLNMDHVFAGAGDYSASYYFTSLHGCKDSVTYEIHVKDYSTLYIPNSFTPNHDDVNDEFKAEGTLIRSFEMYVYDNWGNLVWQTDDISKGWDGKYKGHDALEGVYTFKATMIDTNNKENKYQGQINLIR